VIIGFRFSPFLLFFCPLLPLAVFAAAVATFLAWWIACFLMSLPFIMMLGVFLTRQEADRAPEECVTYGLKIWITGRDAECVCNDLETLPRLRNVQWTTAIVERTIENMVRTSMSTAGEIDPLAETVYAILEKSGKLAREKKHCNAEPGRM
jgi:hypothetical protein